MGRKLREMILRELVLNEGLIKLPQDVVDEVEEWVEQLVLEHAYEQAKFTVKTFDEEEEDEIDSEFKRHRGNVKPIKIYQRWKEFKIRKSEVEEYYKSEGLREGEDISFKVVFVAGSPGGVPLAGGVYRGAKGQFMGVDLVSINPDIVGLSGFIINMIKGDRFDLKKILDEMSKYIDKIMGTFEHELTHLIQTRVFKRTKHSLDVDYYMRPREFDALLRNVYNWFKDLFLQIKRPLSKKEFNDIVSAETIKKDVKLGGGLEVEPNLILTIWKEQDESLWRRAAKSLWITLEKEGLIGN